MIQLPSLATTNKIALNLSEPSTWAGIGVMAGTLGAHLPASYGSYVTALCYLFGGVATFLTTKHPQLAAPDAPAAGATPVTGQ